MEKPEKGAVTHLRTVIFGVATLLICHSRRWQNKITKEKLRQEMCWKVFHLGMALGNVLFGNKDVGHSLIQLTLQLASELWLHIRTT